MRRFSLKPLFCAVFSAWVAVCLSGCAEPIDLSSYVNDDDVTSIVDQGSGTVRITPDDPESKLIPGNKKISGLETDKYYRVEEWDGATFMGVKFVSSSGALSERLSDIGLVKETKAGEGGEIIGLTNRRIYKVTPADPLPDITFVEPAAGYTVYTFPIPAPLLPPPPAYAIAEIPVSSDGSAGPASLAKSQANGEIITLIGQGTNYDYVFFREIGTYPSVAYDFRVVKVVSIEVPPEPGDLNITVSFVLNAAQKTFTLTPATATFSQATLLGSASKVVTVTLDDTGNVFVPASIKWYIGGTAKTWSTATLNIDFADPLNIDLLVIGKYTITIEATAAADGAPYSSSMELVITQ